MPVFNLQKYLPVFHPGFQTGFSPLCALFNIPDKVPAFPVSAIALALNFRTGHGSPCVKVMLLVKSMYVNAGSVFWAAVELWKFSSVWMAAGLPRAGGVEANFSLLNSSSVWFRCCG